MWPDQFSLLRLRMDVRCWLIVDGPLESLIVGIVVGQLFIFDCRLLATGMLIVPFWVADVSLLLIDCRWSSWVIDIIDRLVDQLLIIDFYFDCWLLSIEGPLRVTAVYYCWSLESWWLAFHCIHPCNVLPQDSRRTYCILDPTVRRREHCTDYLNIFK